MAAPRWQVIVLAFALTFLALAGGRQLYEEYAVRRPAEAAVRASGLAQSFSWSADGRQLKVCLRPVADLRAAYTALEEAVGGKADLVIVDRPSPLLEEVYGRAEPALYEAAALSNFTALADRVASLAAAADLDGWRVQVDADRVYLSLREGSAYLYRVVPRRSEQEV